MRCSQEPETRIFGLLCALVALIEMSQTAEISMKLTYPPFVRASRYSPSVARIAGSQRMILLLLAMGCILSAESVGARVIGNRSHRQADAATDGAANRPTGSKSEPVGGGKI